MLENNNMNSLGTERQVPSFAGVYHQPPSPPHHHREQHQSLIKKNLPSPRWETTAFPKPSQVYTYRHHPSDWAIRHHHQNVPGQSWTF